MVCAINTTTDLLSHQVEAVTKLLPTRVGGLFMDMGTGKSRTAIELAKIRQDKISNIIWYCPVSLKETVRYEILKHTDCSDSDINLFNQKTSPENMPTARWHIVGIESVSGSNRVALAVNSLINQSSMVIVDESSYIKGHRSKRTQRITFFAERAKYRLILTGTPISQGIVDLYTQMRFLSPKILGYNSFYAFANNHIEYSEKYKGMIAESHNSAYIAAKIKPYIYQVTKDECLNLPSKLYESRYCTLSTEQESYYGQVKRELLEDIDIEDFNSSVIFRLFTALQQISCGFWNRKITHSDGSESTQRIEIAHERIETLLCTIDCIPKSDKIIIWAKYRYDIQQIKAALAAEYGDESCAIFYGDIKQNQRSIEIEKFRQNARFFIATPSCGGHGLTLNESSTVIFYNNGFKYAERIQAEDRNHRIGQDKRVVYIDITTDSGIDARIQTALASKGSVVKAFKLEVDKIKGSNKGKLKEMIKKL